MKSLLRDFTEINTIYMLSLLPLLLVNTQHKILYEDNNMSLIISYIGEMIYYILVALPIYIIIRYLMVKKKKITTSLVKETILGLFVLYIVGLISQTLLPMWHAGINNGQFYFDVYINKPAPINIIPFHTVYQYLYTNNTAVDGWKTAATLNLWANLLLFSPLGIFLPLLTKKSASLLYVLGIGFITSFFIEFIQFFIGRRADIDDIILNLLGVFLGFITYRLCRLIICSCSKMAIYYKKNQYIF